jgi:ribose-phosphate pyrophosphokinase
LSNAAQALVKGGAKSVVASASHGVLSGPAIERSNDSPHDEVVVTKSIPLSEAALASSKIKTISVAPLLAEAIRRIDSNDSLSGLFV